MEIKGFTGKYRFLSNFWPVTIQYDGDTYPSVENAYQAAKVPKICREKYTCCKPPEAKKFARQEICRDDWEKDKEATMYYLLKQKFKTPSLKMQLLATEDAYLEETNWWGDTYWGVFDGEGLNVLGKLIMTIRTELGENK